MLDGNRVSVVEAAVAGTDYEGWLAWVEGQPIFEAVPLHAQPVVSGGADVYRAESRRVMDWTKLPHMKIERLALFFLRPLYRAEQQPIWSVWRELESDVRLIQFKRRSLVLPANSDQSPGRTRVMRYTMGTWCPSATPHPECRLWDIQANPPKGAAIMQEREGPRRHPCWPLPGRGEAFDPLRHGFGLGPQVVGLTEAEVPDPAPAFAELAR